MARSSTRRSGTILTVVLLLVLAAAGALALVQLSAPGASGDLAALRSAAEHGRASAALRSAVDTGILPWLLVPALGPLVVAIIVLAASRRTEAVAAPPVEGEETAGAGPSGDAHDSGEAGGLKLLATLQEEARLLDFVREDIGGYSDEQVGAAVRGIHAALRKAIDERLEIEPILAGEEGDPVEVPASVPAGHLRLSGRPAGGPPFRGVLRHAGWRATVVRLPAATPGSDPSVLAPAEVEVGEE